MYLTFLYMCISTYIRSYSQDLWNVYLIFKHRFLGPHPRHTASSLGADANIYLSYCSDQEILKTILRLQTLWSVCAARIPSVC